MIAGQRLCEVITDNVKLRLIEPCLYSACPPGENTSDYDGSFGRIYDIVACNRFYNRFVWGYSTKEYRSLCVDAFETSRDGWMLDAGCGSLGFTASLYANHKTTGPVVLLDQSVNMLRMAKARLVKLRGELPSNIVFLHGDVLRLPFKAKSFSAVVSLNVLHVLDDAKSAVRELKRVLSDGGTLSLSTMIENDRCADRYLHMLAKTGMVFPRSEKRLLAAFDETGLLVKYDIKGNMAFLSCRQP